MIASLLTHNPNEAAGVIGLFSLAFLVILAASVRAGIAEQKYRRQNEATK